ncbi:hypothetical protein AVEN_55879-1 [Araneus ventricosus]|uniref:Uncharacterized protein n=1 Tax=Araneus ventricosus TaxID=182803 RepID=A0A4Y2X8F5_ARAVE|nr:hypothetical protein AVEN_55879-1 [Araneus ventricosus]
MARRSEAVSTHTSDAFVDFAYDLLEYAVPKYGCVWVKPSDYERRSMKLFREAFGEVVILFRNRNSHDFNQRLSLVCEMESPDDILLYAAFFRETIFKGHVPLMEFIAYCAFLLDMALICLQLKHLDLLYTIVDDTMEVFHQFIRPYFTVVGGWFSLYRVATQYVRYVTFQPQSNPAASVAKEGFPGTEWQSNM